MPAALEDWLNDRTHDELLEYMQALVGDVDGVGDWLTLRQLSENPEPAALKAEVNAILGSRRHLSYYAAIEHAREARGIVDLLDAASEAPTRELLPVIERALTLATRTVLHGDDSSGALGDIARHLLKTHAHAVQRLAPQLTKKDRLRVADWIVKYRYSGEQDFFDPDIVAYASALGEEGIARYRESIQRQDLGDYVEPPVFVYNLSHYFVYNHFQSFVDDVSRLFVDDRCRHFVDNSAASAG